MNNPSPFNVSFFQLPLQRHSTLVSLFFLSVFHLSWLHDCVFMDKHHPRNDIEGSMMMWHRGNGYPYRAVLGKLEVCLIMPIMLSFFPNLQLVTIILLCPIYFMQMMLFFGVTGLKKMWIMWCVFFILST